MTPRACPAGHLSDHTSLLLIAAGTHTMSAGDAGGTN